MTDNYANTSAENRIQCANLYINKVSYPIFEGLNIIGNSNKDATVIINDERLQPHHAVIIKNNHHFISPWEGVISLNNIKLYPFQTYKLEENAVLHFSDLEATYNFLRVQDTSCSVATQTDLDKRATDIPFDELETQILSPINLQNNQFMDIHDLPTQLISPESAVETNLQNTKLVSEEDVQALVTDISTHEMSVENWCKNNTSTNSVTETSKCDLNITENIVEETILENSIQPKETDESSDDSDDLKAYLHNVKLQKRKRRSKRVLFHSRTTGNNRNDAVASLHKSSDESDSENDFVRTKSRVNKRKPIIETSSSEETDEEKPVIETSSSEEKPGTSRSKTVKENHDSIKKKESGSETELEDEFVVVNKKTEVTLNDSDLIPPTQITNDKNILCNKQTNLVDSEYCNDNQDEGSCSEESICLHLSEYSELTFTNDSLINDKDSNASKNDLSEENELPKVLGKNEENQNEEDEATQPFIDTEKSSTQENNEHKCKEIMDSTSECKGNEENQMDEDDEATPPFIVADAINDNMEQKIADTEKPSTQDKHDENKCKETMYSTSECKETEENRMDEDEEATQPFIIADVINDNTEQKIDNTEKSSTQKKNESKREEIEEKEVMDSSFECKTNEENQMDADNEATQPFMLENTSDVSIKQKIDDKESKFTGIKEFEVMNTTTECNENEENGLEEDDEATQLLTVTEAVEQISEKSQITIPSVDESLVAEDNAEKISVEKTGDERKNMENEEHEIEENIGSSTDEEFEKQENSVKNILVPSSTSINLPKTDLGKNQNQNEKDVNINEENKNEDDEEIFLMCTQKLIRIEDFKNTKELNEDNLFLQPTQKLIRTSDKIEDSNMEKATKTKESASENNVEDDEFLQPTQKLIRTSDKIEDNNMEKAVKTKESVSENDVDDDIFLQPTQKLVRTNHEKKQNVITNAEEIEDDVFLQSTQKLPDRENEETDLFLQPTQLLDENIFKKPKSKFSEIESQLEVMFSSQNNIPDLHSRPANPLLNLFKDTDSQNTEKIDENENCDNKLKENVNESAVKETMSSTSSCEEGIKNDYKKLVIIEDRRQTRKTKRASSIEDKNDNLNIKKPRILRSKEPVSTSSVQDDLETSTAKDDTEKKEEAMNENLKEKLTVRGRKTRKTNISDVADEPLLVESNLTISSIKNTKKSENQQENKKEQKMNENLKEKVTIRGRKTRKTNISDVADEPLLVQSNLTTSNIKNTEKSESQEKNKNLEETSGLQESATRKTRGTRKTILNNESEELASLPQDSIRKKNVKEDTNQTEIKKLEEQINKPVTRRRNKTNVFDEPIATTSAVQDDTRTSCEENLEDTRQMDNKSLGNQMSAVTRKRNAQQTTPNVRSNRRNKQNETTVQESDDDFVVAPKNKSNRSVLPSAPKRTRRSRYDTEGSDESNLSNVSTATSLSMSDGSLLSTPQRLKRKQKPKVVFTMFDSPEMESLIRSLGGSVVDTVDACTVLVTKSVKRTQKLLSAVGQGKSICSPQWLVESKKKSSFLDPWDYILLDKEAENKWNFSLRESLIRSQNHKIFENYLIQIIVNGCADVLKSAIESCGGKCVTRVPPKNSINNNNFIVVSSPENKSKYSKYLKQKPPVTVVTTEAIFDGVLRQELHFEEHLLF